MGEGESIAWQLSLIRFENKKPLGTFQAVFLIHVKWILARCAFGSQTLVEIFINHKHQIIDFVFKEMIGTFDHLMF